MKTTFCQAKNNTIIDPYGKPLYLKGVGIGGWLLLEGYMIQSYQEIDRPRRIWNHIEELVDGYFAESFFEEWYKRFFTEKDVRFLKEEGFNCIRIPIDYAFLFEPSDQSVKLKEKEQHFQLLDAMIQCCHEEKMYVMLDLHAAPGGQTGTNIDNSKDNQPELFMKKIYQDQLVYVWQTIASRYHQEEYIVAYDLLNEPLPNWFGEYYHMLYPLYERVIEAIRTIDPHHMISLEGVHWSTDLTMFDSLPDDNILLQFHKYWSNPDQESIQAYLDLQHKLHVPLIMGEGGENNVAWYSSVFKMYEQLDISFAFWTYKKMEMNNSLVSFQKPGKWESFLEGQVTKEEAIDVLRQLLKNISYDASIYHQDVSNHILRKDSFKTPSYGFDYAKKEETRHYENKHKASFRKTDYLKIATIDGKVVEPNFKQYNGEDIPVDDRLYLFLHPNEWITYTFHVSTDGKVLIEVYDQTLGAVELSVDGMKYSHKDGRFICSLKRGKHMLKVLAKEVVRLNEISFTKM